MKIRNFMSLDSEIKSGSVTISTHPDWIKHEEKYKTIRKQIKSAVFKIDGYPGYIVYVEYPSSIPDHHYQVLLQLWDESKKNKAKRIEDMNVRIFSNCPSFIYKFAYIYYNHVDPDTGEKNIIIADLHKKYNGKGTPIVRDTEELLGGEEVLGNYPKKRNPSGLPLLDDSVACAMMHVNEKYKPLDLTMYFTRSTYDRFINRIYDVDTIKVIREKHKIEMQKVNAKKRLQDAPPRVKKAVLNALDNGDVVRINKDHTIKARESTSITRHRATTIKPKKSINTSGVNKLKKK